MTCNDTNMPFSAWEMAFGEVSLSRFVKMVRIRMDLWGLFKNDSRMCSTSSPLVLGRPNPLPLQNTHYQSP